MEEERKEKGKMIESEDKEETKVTFQTYKQYSKYLGGFCFFFFPMILNLMFIVMRSVTDFSVGEWAKAKD